MSALRPDELRSLLHDAVDDLRPSPTGYERIQAGIARRRRWRVPAFAAGAAALAGLAALAFFAISPRGHNAQIVEPASPVTSRVGSGGVATTAVPGTATGPASGSPAPPVVGPPATTSPARSASPRASALTTPPSETPSPGNSRATRSRAARTGDIDGDGVVDPPITYNGTALVVTLSHSGQAKAVTLAGVVTPLHYTVVDLDEDGVGEILVEVSGSGSGTTYAVVRLRPDGSLRVLGGSPLPLVAGASSASGRGFACSGDLVTVRSGTSDDGVAFQVTSTVWRLSGVTFQPVGKATVTTYDTTSNALDPFVAKCGSLN